MNEFKFLGRHVSQPVRELDTFPSSPSISKVIFTSGELATLCPVTGQPDFNSVTIEYEPIELCLESKSLKLYLWSFRDEASFCEALAHQFVDDIYTAIQPRWCRVTIVQNVRGGLQLTVQAGKDQASTGKPG